MGRVMGSFFDNLVKSKSCSKWVKNATIVSFNSFLYYIVTDTSVNVEV